jgi:parallel beta-helix repeat protein
MNKAVKSLLIAILTFTLFASTVWIQSTLPQAVAATSDNLPNYTINRDGKCDAPNISQNGNIYTLTGNIEGTILIDRDGVVLNGAGFTLHGKGDSTGIRLYDKSNVVIKNIIVRNFKSGIQFNHEFPPFPVPVDPNPNRPTNCTISECQLSNNTIAIAIYGVNCKITANNVTNNDEGITFSGSGNIFRNNHMENNRLSFWDSGYITDVDVDTSNTVNGKPVYYMVNQHDTSVPADAGMVVLKGCKNILIQNLDINHVFTAITLVNSSNCRIIANTAAENKVGILLRYSVNNTIQGNQILNNTEAAIQERQSKQTTIMNNLIKGNGAGIENTLYGVDSSNAVILNNQIIDNNGTGILSEKECIITGNYIAGNGKDGIFFYDISNSIINKNIITQNGERGLSVWMGENASVTGNEVSKNMVGIRLSKPSECTIALNNIEQNSNYAILIEADATNNSFYLNNFLNNNNGSRQVSFNPVFAYYGNLPVTAHVIPQFIGYPNIWDNGTVGNYWTDTPSGGALHKMDLNNVDNHPMSAPFQFTQPEIPQVGLETQQKGLRSFELLSVIVAAVAALAVIMVAVALFTKSRLKKKGATGSLGVVGQLHAEGYHVKNNWDKSLAIIRNIRTIFG